MQLGFYVAGVSGSNVDRELSILANNIANSSTVGYKADRTSFATALANKTGSSNNSAAFAGAGEQYVDLRAGALHRTGNTLDFGIQGNGYFRVRMDDGSIGYTRAGNFQLDGQGRLTTADGKMVLGTGGQPITVPKGDVSVSADGTFHVEGGGNAGQLGLVQFADPRQVKKKAGVLLTTPPSNVKSVGPDVKVVQGFVEASNVNSVQEMTQLMSVQRNFQSMMKIIDQYSQQMTTLSQKVGRVQG